MPLTSHIIAQMDLTSCFGNIILNETKPTQRSHHRSKFVKRGKRKKCSFGSCQTRFEFLSQFRKVRNAFECFVAQVQTRLPKTKRVWSMKINVICTVQWIPITTDGLISNTGHCRRRYTRFTQLCICSQNTLKIHGRVLWPKPVTTDDFIINTGHCRRLYTRFTQLCVTPQNTLIIHGRVL